MLRWLAAVLVVQEARRSDPGKGRKEARIDECGGPPAAQCLTPAVAQAGPFARSRSASSPLSGREKK